MKLSILFFISIAFGQVYAGDVVNKTTLQYLKSVNTPDYPKADWVINPDQNVIQTVDPRYWKVSGDSLVESSSGEKAAIDAVKLPEDISVFSAQLKIKLESYLKSKYSSADLIAISVIHQAAIAEGKTDRAAMCAKLSIFLTTIYTYQSQKIDEIDAAADIKALQLITFDLDQFDAVDPKLTIKEILAIDS